MTLTKANRIATTNFIRVALHGGKAEPTPEMTEALAYVDTFITHAMGDRDMAEHIESVRETLRQAMGFSEL